MTTLLHERGTLGFALSATLDVAVRKLIALAKERNVTDPVLLDRIAREWIELQALKYTNYRSLTALTKTGIPGPEGSASKLVWSEANQRLTKLAQEIVGGPELDEYWTYTAAPLARQHDRGGDERDPPQHRRRARARAAEEALMDFSFTSEQDDLRREARAFLEANPAPSDAQLEELGWKGILASETSRSSTPPCCSRSSGACCTRERSSRTRSATIRAGCAPPTRSRRSASARARPRWRSPTSPTASSSARRSARTRRSRTRSSTPTSPSSSAGRSRTGPRGASPRTTSRPTSRVAAAKSQATEAAVLACEKSIQAHGGIGFTWEHPLHRYYKRALWLESALGYGRELSRGDRAIPSVVVTGASSGIGEATARRLAALGWDVYASVRAAGEAPAGTHELVFDVTDADAVARAAAGIESLDALVDNAGIAIASPLEYLPPEELTRQLDVNVVGQLRVLQAFLPALRRAARPDRADGVDRRPLGAAVPRRVRDVEVRARGDGRRAALRVAAVGDRGRRSSSPARSRRRSGRSRSARSRSSRRKRSSSTASASRSSGASPPRARRRTAVPADDVAKAVEHALTSPEAAHALPRRPGRATPGAGRAASRPAPRPRPETVPVRVDEERRLRRAVPL